MKRGDIYYADLNPSVGSEQDGIRPIVILQNNLGNKHSPTVIVASVTRKSKTNMPTHVHIGKFSSLEDNSYIQLEQIRTLDKKRLFNYVGTLSINKMIDINKALKISFAIE